MAKIIYRGLLHNLVFPYTDEKMLLVLQWAEVYTKAIFTIQTCVKCNYFVEKILKIILLGLHICRCTYVHIWVIPCIDIDANSIERFDIKLCMMNFF